MNRLFVLPMLCALATCPALAQQPPQPPQALLPLAPLAQPLPPLTQPLAQPSQPLLVVPQAPAPAPPAAPPPRSSRPPQAPPAPAPVPSPAPAPAPAAPAPPAPPLLAVDTTPPQLVNIQLDITILEEATGAAPIRKTVTLTVADREAGSSRASERFPGAQGILNVDVMPNLQKNGRILTRVGLEYQNVKEQPFVQVRAQPLLDSGKPLRVSRSASPNGDRTVTVDVTATILK